MLGDFGPAEPARCDFRIENDDSRDSGVVEFEWNVFRQWRL